MARAFYRRRETGRASDRTETVYDFSRTAVYLVSVYLADVSISLAEAPNDGRSPNRLGWVVYDSWLKASGVRPGIKLDRIWLLPGALKSIIALSDCPRVASCLPEDKCHGPGALCLAPRPGVLGKPATTTLTALVEHFKGYASHRLSVETGAILRPESLWQQHHFEVPLLNERQLKRSRIRP